MSESPAAELGHWTRCPTLSLGQGSGPLSPSLADCPPPFKLSHPSLNLRLLPEPPHPLLMSSSEPPPSTLPGHLPLFAPFPPAHTSP